MYFTVNRSEDHMYCYHCMRKIADGSARCVHCGKPTFYSNYPHHLKPGTVLNNKFLVGATIGEGGFGITYIGLDLILERKIAIKEFYPSGYANRNNTYSNEVIINYDNEGAYFRTGVEHFLLEAKNIAKFHDEKSIVDVIAFFEENNTAYIVMEYLEGENLSERVDSQGVYAPAEIFRLFLPIMNTLEKMHRENIIHRDITPENVRILPDGSLKLIDFGSARYYTGMNKKTLSVQFKPGYAPVEQYNKNGRQGPWTDVYGLCATIYKCITGVTPVDSLERLQNDSLKTPSSLGVKISNPLESVLMYGLAVAPEKRCKSMTELQTLSEQALDGRVADVNRTVYADRTYGDTNMYSNARPDSFSNDIADGDFERPNKSKLPVAVIIVAVSLVVLAVIILIIVFANISKNKGSDTAVTQAPTQAVTERVTEQPTEQSMVTVPDFSGKKLSDAANELSSLGLMLDTQYEESDTVAEGYVIRQTIVAGRQVNKGDTVMLVVSSGKKAESSDSSSSQSSYWKPESSDYESESSSGDIDISAAIAQIRTDYYATNADPGTKKTINGVDYFYKNGSVTKINCPKSSSGMSYSREYYFKNDKLYFAFFKDGSAEDRLYFYDDELIRFIDEKGTTFDYDGSRIDCPFREQAINESYALLDLYY